MSLEVDNTQIAMGITVHICLIIKRRVYWELFKENSVQREIYKDV